MVILHSLDTLDVTDVLADLHGVDMDLEPWSSRVQQDLLISNADSQSLYHTLTKKPPKEPKKPNKVAPQEKRMTVPDSDQTVLFRVARKKDEDSKDSGYTHSKKVIELECIEDDKVDMMKESPSIRIEQKPNTETKRVVVKPSEFQDYFLKFEDRKPQIPKAKTVPAEYIPRIPFSPHTEEEVTHTPNPKHDAPSLLCRSNDSSKITVITPTSSIMEWRRQRIMASMSIKQLKKIFPSMGTLNQKLSKKRGIRDSPQRPTGLGENWNPDSAPNISSLVLILN
jgi:hypothetical protein